MSRRLFIASSREGLPYAEKLKLLLDKKLENDGFDIRCEIWHELGSAMAGNSNLEDLVEIAEEARMENGYAIAMCTPDDEVIICGETYSVARDNVIFEFGLFAGALGRNCVFAVFPEGSLPDGKAEFWLPTDLNGIRQISYRYQGEKPGLSALEDALYKPVDTVLTNIKRQEKLRVEKLRGGFSGSSVTTDRSGFRTTRRPFENR